MLKKNSVILDTNIIIRFLIGDNEKLYKEAEKIFSRIENGEINAIIMESVFAETVFVLEKVYKVEREKIVLYLSKILELKGIKYGTPIFHKALFVYRSKKIDIVDCLIAAYSVINNIPVESFDKDIGKAIKLL